MKKLLLSLSLFVMSLSYADNTQQTQNPTEENDVAYRGGGRGGVGEPGRGAGEPGRGMEPGRGPGEAGRPRT